MLTLIWRLPSRPFINRNYYIEHKGDQGTLGCLPTVLKWGSLGANWGREYTISLLFPFFHIQYSTDYFVLHCFANVGRL